MTKQDIIETWPRMLLRAPFTVVVPNGSNGFCYVNDKEGGSIATFYSEDALRCATAVAATLNLVFGPDDKSTVTKPEDPPPEPLDAAASVDPLPI